jgi:hypothetical protein
MQLEQQSSPSQAVVTAALWLASISVADVPRPLVPHLRRQFNVTAFEAVDVIRRAEAIRREGRK